MATSQQSTKRKYDPEASESVRENLEEMKAGTLESGRSGKKVTNPKQAIAIGLSEARRDGAKVPPPKPKKASGSAAKKKSSSKRKA
jgi:hypothetical protein